MKTPKSQPYISLVAPVFNEIDTINLFYTRASRAISQFEYELILIDDGSTDSTKDALMALAKKDKRVKVIFLSRNFGHQIAISAGIKSSCGDAVVVIDSDLQDPPEVIPKLVKKWQQGFEVVYALRKTRNDSFFKQWTAKIFYRLLKASSEIDIPEGTGDFRLIDKKVVKEFNKFSEKSRYVRGIFPWIGFNHAPVYFDRDKRCYGKTKYSLRKMFRLTWHALTSFSSLPLRLPYYFAIAMATLALVLGLLAFINGNDINKIILFGSAAVILIGSVQLSVMGIMGEYLARIYSETQNRPLYIIKDKINF